MIVLAPIALLLLLLAVAELARRRRRPVVDPDPVITALRRLYEEHHP